MSTQLNILLIDDDPRTVVFLSDTLGSHGYKVVSARSGKEGIDIAKRAELALIILDIRMPEIDGYEVCRRLKADAATRKIPILMLTALSEVTEKIKGFDAGADDYLVKPYNLHELLARVNSLLKRSIAPSFADLHDHCDFRLSVNPNQLMHLRVTGSYGVATSSGGVLALNTDTFARLGDTSHVDNWRFNAKVCGDQLYNKIFVQHPDIHLHYKRALGEVKEDSKLHIRFENSREHLRVPLEFMCDEGSRETQLALRHPLVRSVTNIEVNRRGLGPGFFRTLWEKDRKLRVLLIASNTKPSIPGVDSEVSALPTVIKNVFSVKGIVVEVEMVPTERATYAYVRGLLERCDYHIVHYAGHGTYDARSPEKSYLHLWENEDKQGKVKRMSGAEIQILLGGSDVRFVYLSCCYGTTTGSRIELQDDDFLGIADSILVSGVPGVLGFRWPVSDVGAAGLSIAFYSALAASGQIDTALLNARRAMAARNRDDNAWLTPIAIVQE